MRLLIMKFKSYFFAFLILAAAALTPVHAADLYAFLIGDTTDETLGLAMDENLKKMKGEMEKIADATGLKLRPVILKGKQVSRNNLLNNIKKQQIKNDDVVILYFSMHGYRTESKENQWPNLYFTLDQNGVDLDYLNDLVLQKKPRFLLSMADSCNSFVPEGIVPTLEKRMVNRFSTNFKEFYKKLFLDTKGVIIVSGSIPGQYSWGLNGFGTFLTLSFLQSFEHVEAEGLEPSWENILSKTSDEVGVYCALYNVDQTPQYVLQIDKK